jgi:dTDP-glucose 4,6-dehydratase
LPIHTGNWSLIPARVAIELAGVDVVKLKGYTGETSLKNVLITGAAGFIGANFTQYLLKTRGDVNLVGFDLLTYAGNEENLAPCRENPRFTFIHGSISDRALLDRVMAEHAIDTVVNFAAETHVDRSILGPIQFLETNVVGTCILLEAARAAWKGRGTDEVRFHHISTDEVFGSLAPGEAPFSETNSYQPNSPYSASKAGSDHLVRAYAHTYGLQVSISNCTNNYGPYQFPEKLIPLMILNCLEGKPLPVYGDGRQVRDWLYVEDHCEAIGLILEKGRAGETYLIGGNNQPTNLEIIEIITGIMDDLQPESPYKPHIQLVKHVVDRPGHDRRYAMDISHIKRELGWQPKVDLKTGLRKTVEWYLSNQDWIRHLTQNHAYSDWTKANYGNRGEEK